MTALLLDPQLRRTFLALAFVGAGVAMTGLAIWLVVLLLDPAWPAALAAMRLRLIGGALYAVLALNGIVVAGLGMSVALRQLSARFMGADFSAAGGEAGRP